MTNPLSSKSIINGNQIACVWEKGFINYARLICKQPVAGSNPITSF
jgi:hypothetical protein